jgi:hypothetical protein
MLLENVKEILQDEFLGLYLYGSLSSGDFHPEASDIDFLVVTRNPISENITLKLERMHNKLWSSGLHWASKLEGSYIPQTPLRRYQPSAEVYPTINEARFYVAPHGSDWIIQRHIIREYGKALDGPDPKSLIDPVPPEEIKRAVLGILHEWWFPMLDNPAWLRDHNSHYHSYAILTMCRVLHALEHGTIVSKPLAAKWAQENFKEWDQVIAQALDQRIDKGHYELYDASIRFIRFTKDWIEAKNIQTHT